MISYTYIENIYTCDARVEEFASMAGEEISPQAEEDIMTIAERLRQESRSEGELKGTLKVARRMLDEGSDLVFIVKVTGLAVDQIKALQKNK